MRQADIENKENGLAGIEEINAESHGARGTQPKVHGSERQDLAPKFQTMNLVHAICDGCGQHATGTPQELHEAGWALNVGERSDELCDKCKSAPAPPVNERFEF